MAGGIIARLKANGLAGKVPVTGQDASVEGLQRVLAGTQCMTVYKDTNLEAKAASDLAIALINGDDALRPTRSRPARSTDTVPATTFRRSLATPESIFADNVQGRRRRRLPDRPRTSARGEFAKALHEVRRPVSPPRRGGPSPGPAPTAAVPTVAASHSEPSTRSSRVRTAPRARRRAADRAAAVSCAASTRASAPCTCCAASTSTSAPAASPPWSATTAPARAP